MKTRKALSLLLALALALGLILTPGLLSAPARAAQDTPALDTPGVDLVSAVGQEETGKKLRMETLMVNIAAAYTENSGDWVLMDMAAYGKLGLSDARSSNAARQTYLNEAIAALRGEEAGDTVCAKAVLALTAIGVDAAQLYPAGSAAAFSAVDKLNAAAQSPSAGCAPYTLAAYNQGNFPDTAPYEAILVDSILDTQAEDGSWSEWGERIQTTANMIAGLAFYQTVNAAAANAIDRALNYLSAAQKADGSFDAYGYGADANTCAAVVIALAAAGVNPDADPRFVKGGNSALDGLLRFAYADGSGFGFQRNEKGETVSAAARATEQAFRALIAAYQVMTTGTAYNVYDFSGGVVTPGYEGAAVRSDAVKKVPVTLPGATFPDIAGHAAQAAVEALAQRAIITGKDTGLFDPDAAMTRAEFAAIVVRALGLETQTCGAFSDVQEGDWFAPYVGAAWLCGIVTGRGEGIFDPQGTISRQEAATMVARAAKLCGLDTGLTDGEILDTLSRFGDSAAIDAWARQSVAFCYSAAILDPSAPNAEPAAAILRCEIAQMLYNLLDSAGLL